MSAATTGAFRSAAASGAGVNSSPLADCRFGRVRRLHGEPRHHHRQRGAALHRRRHGGERGRSVLGDHHLSGRQRGQLDGEQLSRAAAGPQVVLSDVFRPVHRKLGAVRVRAQPAGVAAVPHPARARRRRHGAGLAIDFGGCVSAGKAWPGFRAVRHRRRRGAGGRPDARRLDFRQLVLAMVL